MTTRSTFTKKTATGTVVQQQPLIPEGTKKSPQLGQLLISSGSSDLDYILGGGFAVGSLVLIEEDETSTLYKSILKYFLGEGVARSQAITVASAQPGETITKELPHISTSSLQSKESETDSSGSSSDSLKIAWQYQKYLKNDAQLGQAGSRSGMGVWCSNLDLSRTLAPSILESSKITNIELSQVDSKSSSGKAYHSRIKKLYSQLNSRINASNSEFAKTKKATIERIAIMSLGSPNWGNYSEDEDKMTLQLLHALRGLLRSSLAVCVVTIPAKLMGGSFVNKLGHIADTVLNIETFHGLLGINRILII
eukprot:TRINITY_DN7448_c0_g1_i1.p1 TRINITY_DN7448_c0_g1~~TRINITY_DN7448_c0_g1_i1.p1  ORF type:complete len:309 (+),score=46.70 TRINITY_DN7448_c0_g1_i1:31-957(+)